MKKFCLIIIISISASIFSLYAQNFTSLIRTSLDDTPTNIVSSVDCYFIAMVSTNENMSVIESRILKIEFDGNIQDSLRVFPEFNRVYTTNIDTCLNGKITVVSYVKNHENSVYYDILLCEFEQDFRLVDSVRVPFGAKEIGYSHLNRDSNGNYILTGSAQFDAIDQVFALKFNNQFIVTDAKIFGHEYGQFCFSTKLIPGSSEFLFANFGNSLVNTLGCLIRTDSVFNVISADTITHKMHLYYNIGFISDSIFILSGKRDPEYNPNRDDNFQLMLLDTLNICYQSVVYGAYDTMDYPANTNISITNQGNIFGGATKNAIWYMGNFSSWFSLYYMNPSLSLEWVKYYGDGCNWMLREICATSDGGCLMAGTRYDWLTQYNERDAILVKVDSTGLITSTGPGPEMRAHDAIVYPNPGSSVINIESGPQISGAWFYLFDLAGKLVASKLITDQKEALQTSALPSGVYLWNIVFKDKTLESGKWVKAD